MRLVEIIRGLATSDEVYQIVEDASAKMGKCRYGAKTCPGSYQPGPAGMINRPGELYEGVAPAEISTIS